MKTDIEIFNNKLEWMFTKHIFVLIVICGLSLFLRLYFTRFDFPLESQDAFLYLIQGRQIASGNFEGLPVNIGWQLFLSFFFKMFSYENNYGYMQVVRIITICVSIVTIPIVYTLSNKFLNKKFSLLATSFFAFDPNLIENSIFGITESLFILCGVLSILFILHNKIKYAILSGLVVGYAFDIRLNGLVLLIICISSFFLKKESKKERIQKIIIFLGIFFIVITPFFVLNYQLYANPIGNFLNLPSDVEKNVPPSIDASQLNLNLKDKLFFAVSEEIKHLVRISIPYLVLFVPYGMIFILSRFQYSEKIIFLTIVVSLIVAIPQYTLSDEYRNLFLILPFFSIIGAIGIHKLIDTKKNENLFLLLIVIGIIILSTNMLRERNSIDLELLEEKEKFGMFVATNFDGKMMGDLYTQIAHNLPDARITLNEVGQIRNDKLVLLGFGPPSKTVNDILKYSRENNVKYLIIDDNYESRSPQFVDIYYNPNNYTDLKEIFDSDKNGYKKLHVKIFEINYSKLE